MNSDPMTWLQWAEALSLREWCRRKDFRDSLPELLGGEDEDFQDHIRKIAAAETAKTT